MIQIPVLLAVIIIAMNIISIWVIRRNDKIIREQEVIIKRATAKRFIVGCVASIEGANKAAAFTNVSFAENREAAIVNFNQTYKDTLSEYNSFSEYSVLEITIS